MTDESKTLNAAAKTFTMSAAASSWTPTFVAPPPCALETVTALSSEISIQDNTKPTMTDEDAPNPTSTEPPQVSSENPSRTASENPSRTEQVETTRPATIEKEEEETIVDVGDEDPREHLNIVFIGHVDAGTFSRCVNMWNYLDSCEYL